MFANLKNGVCSIREISEWKIENWKDSHFFGSPVSLPPDYAKSLPRSIRRSMSSIALYSAYAAQQAAADSGLSLEEIAGGRCGCIVGSTMGGSSAIAESYRICVFGKGMEEMSSMQFFKCVSHTAVQCVALVQCDRCGPGARGGLRFGGPGDRAGARPDRERSAGHGDVRRSRRTCAGGVRFV